MNQSHASKGEVPPQFRHASAEAYAAFLQAFARERGYARPRKEQARLLLCRTRFVQCYPELSEWFAAPLIERVGRLYQEDYNHSSYPISYRARFYLIFLALRGYACMDWDWLIATHKLGLEPFLPILGCPSVLPSLVETAVNLGYERRDAQMTLSWGVSRVLLHVGTPDLTAIRATHLAEFEQAVADFGERPDVASFFGLRERYQQGIREEYLIGIHLLQTVLYH